MPNLKSYLGSLRFWLTISAAAAFTVGAIRASAAAAIAISSPQANQIIVGQQVPVSLDVGSFQLVDFSKYPKSRLGQGHIHIWLDQTQPTPASAIKSASSAYTFDNVKAGQHTLLVELVNNDHSSLSPKATASVTFTTQPPSSTANGSSVFMMTIIAFLLVAAALFLVSPKLKDQSKTPPRFGTHPKKLARKSSKRK